jgi:hypothetical protein
VSFQNADVSHMVGYLVLKLGARTTRLSLLDLARPVSLPGLSELASPADLPWVLDGQDGPGLK